MFISTFYMRSHIIPYICLKSMRSHIMKTLAEFVKNKRKEAKLTQEQFAERAGVALTIVRKIEQGKENVKLEKVNQVLKMFGHLLVPVSSKELSLKKDNSKP